MRTEQEYKDKIKKLFQADETSIVDYELTNVLYKNKNKILAAIKLGLECLENYPENEFFWKFLGLAYNLNEDFEKSIECVFKKVSINPQNPYNWIDLSFAYRSYGEIITSDWINFNLELFMDYYEQMGFKELNEKNLINILQKIKKQCDYKN